MKKETKLALLKLNDASDRLKEGLLAADDELGRDGVIQRFEFTFEMFWKSLKLYLADEGVICKTPRECLKSAFRIGVFEDEAVFLDMLEDRNKTAHIYSREESESIFERIKTRYHSQIEVALKNIKNKMSNEFWDA